MFLSILINGRLLQNIILAVAIFICTSYPMCIFYGLKSLFTSYPFIYTFLSTFFISNFNINRFFTLIVLIPGSNDIVIQPVNFDTIIKTAYCKMKLATMINNFRSQIIKHSFRIFVYPKFYSCHLS